MIEFWICGFSLHCGLWNKLMLKDSWYCFTITRSLCSCSPFGVFGAHKFADFELFPICTVCTDFSYCQYMLQFTLLAKHVPGGSAPLAPRWGLYPQTPASRRLRPLTPARSSAPGPRSQAHSARLEAQPALIKIPGYVADLISLFRSQNL